MSRYVSKTDALPRQRRLAGRRLCKITSLFLRLLVQFQRIMKVLLPLVLQFWGRQVIFWQPEAKLSYLSERGR
jgi:hypothetical protein